MKTEGEFNALLTKELRKVDKVMIIKSADKYRAGLSDFIMWKKGQVVCAETKFVTSLPKSTESNALKHPFSPVQITFMQRSRHAGARCFGIIGVKAWESIYVLHAEDIQENFKLQYLQEHARHFLLSRAGIREMADQLLFGGLD